MKKLIIWGGTGNFRVLCELFQDDYEILGYFDNNPKVREPYRGIPCMGNKEAFLHWMLRYPGERLPDFMVSLGPGHGAARRMIYEELLAYGLGPTRAVHRTAFVASNAEIGPGSSVYAMASVATDARIGICCQINTRASVDHDCVLGDGVSIGPGAVLAGEIEVGPNADIYTGAVVLPRVRIGEGAVVGAGAVVRHDVEPYATVVGNPARILRVKKPDQAI